MRRIWMMAGGVGVPGGPMALAALLFFLSGLGPARGAAPAPKLNVVLILADDLGWTDLACYGSKLYETPNIDRLARDGVKFNQAYSACTVCSPTRAALLTGKYPARLHITDWIPGLPPENPKLLVPDWTKYLPLEEISLGRAFKSAGYATASLGKWHLGGEAYWPDKHGFDLNLAGTEAPSPKSYFSPYNIATLPEGPEGEYLTDRLGVEAGKYLERHQDKPFFLYLPHFAVHLPVQGKQPIVKKYREKISSNSSLLQTNAGYAAMVRGALQLARRHRRATQSGGKNAGQGEGASRPLARLAGGSGRANALRQPAIRPRETGTRRGSGKKEKEGSEGMNDDGARDA